MNDHYLIHSIYTYFGFVVFGRLFNFILNRSLGEKDKNKINDINSQTLSSESSYKNIKKLSKLDIFVFITICIIFIIYFESIKIIEFFKLDSLRIWTIKVAFVLIFMHNYFPQHLYKHQILSMILIFSMCAFLKIFLTLIDYKQQNNNIYKENGILVCIDIIAIYNFLTFIISFAEVKIKDFIDRKYISLYLIVMLIGILGLIITSVSALFFYLFGQYCNNNLKDHLYCYGDSLSYFDEFKDNLAKKYSYLKIFLITPVYLFIEFFSFTFSILIIKDLNPIYLLLTDNTYDLIYDLVDYFKNDKKNNYFLTKFVVSEIDEIFQIIGFLIYLEIIELRFFGLNENIRKNIIKRGEYDFENEGTDDLNDTFHFNNSNIFIEQYKVNISEDESIFNE